MCASMHVCRHAVVYACIYACICVCACKHVHFLYSMFVRMLTPSISSNSTSSSDFLHPTIPRTLRKPKCLRHSLYLVQDPGTFSWLSLVLSCLAFRPRL